MNPQFSQNEFSARQAANLPINPVSLRTNQTAQYLNNNILSQAVDSPSSPSIARTSAASKSVQVDGTMPVSDSTSDSTKVPDGIWASHRVPSGATVGLSATLLLAGLIGATPVQAAIVVGDSGSQVTAMQQSLVQLGFDTGGIDGVFGPKTLKALIRFQQARNLQADGVLGPQTSQALAIVAPMGSGPELSSAKAAGPAIVATASQKGINIRQTPNGAVIGYAMDGVKVSLTGRESSASGRTWVEIATGGWIAEDFVKAGAIASAAQPATGTYSTSTSAAENRLSLAQSKTLKTGAGQAYVKASRLNIRSSPGGAVIGYAKSGTALMLTGSYKTSDGYEWAELTSGGWVATPFLK
jgi:peptidoglycan hydrolase-like protein with peptidoglycan-binding domain